MDTLDFLAGQPSPYDLDGHRIYLIPVTFGDLRRSADMDELERVGYIASCVITDADGQRLFDSADDALDGIAPAHLVAIVQEATRRTEVGALSPLRLPDSDSPNG